MTEIRAAQTKDDFALAQTLFVEYQTVIGVDLCFQNFQQELTELAERYSPPAGGLKLLYCQGQPAGVVAVRAFEGDCCEMKRLYMRRQYRMRGYGRLLALEAISLGRELGYKKMRLDTLPSMTTAIALYKSLGFREIKSYRDNPIKGAVYMEIDLQSAPVPSNT